MRKILLTLILLILLATIGGFATFSAFTSTTSNSGNQFAAGTVYISDNDSGSAMYSVSNQSPDSPAVVRCIKVTYTGTMDADVKIYASAVGAVGQYIDLLVETGSGNPTFSGCTGFTPDAAPTLYSGTLKNFADTYTSFASGLADNPGTATKWVTNDAVVYRFTLTLQDDNGANGGATPLSTGAHSFTWEAQNQ
jgi:hypothetical protein